MYIVDTNVISDVHRGLRLPQLWLASVPSHTVHFSVVTLSEIRKGVIMLEHSNHPKAMIYAQWLDGIREEFRGKFLPVSEAVAMESGRIAAIRTRDVHDCQIAATAIVHGLAVVTRNVADFADLPVAVINPWANTV